MVRHAFGFLLLALSSVAAFAGVEEDAEPILLIAKKQINDPSFHQTVVLVTFPQDAGPLGVVLNRAFGITLGELFKESPKLAGRKDMLHFGGPVERDGILFLFRSPQHPLKALPVIDDVYLSGDGKLFATVTAQPEDPDNQKFFAGYAGWAEGQLNVEIERGDWFVQKVDAQVLFKMAPETMWERLHLKASSPTASNVERNTQAVNQPQRRY